MKILIVGGGRQIGHFMLEKLSLDNNNKISIFNKTKKDYSNYNIYKHYIGDRNTDFKIIKEDTFDCIVDLCAYNLNLSINSLSYFRDKTNNYIFISTSYIYHYLYPEKYKINPNVINKLDIYNYAKEKYLIEKYIIENFRIYHIVRSVPLISHIDHTQRTSRLINYLKCKAVYKQIYKKSIQVNTAEKFTDTILDKIYENNLSISDCAGCNISIERIYKKLNLSLFNEESKKINFDVESIPFFEFNCLFPGNTISPHHIFEVLLKVKN